MWFIGKKIYIAVCNFFVVQQALWENCTFAECLDVVVCLLSGTRQKKHLQCLKNSTRQKQLTWQRRCHRGPAIGVFFSLWAMKSTRESICRVPDKWLTAKRAFASRCVLCALCHVLHTAKFQTFLFANIRLYYLLHDIVLYANQPLCENLRNSNFIT